MGRILDQSEETGMAGNHLSRVLYLQSNRGEVKIEKMGYVFLIRVQMIPSFSGL